MLQATTWSCIAQLSTSLEMTAFQGGFLAVIGIQRLRPPEEIKLIHNQSHTLWPGLEQHAAVFFWFITAQDNFISFTAGSRITVILSNYCPASGIRC